MPAASGASRRAVLGGLVSVAFAPSACAAAQPAGRLFVAMEGARIPADKSVISTTGFSRTGMGAARYHHVPAAAGEPVPATAFRAADGRLFRLQTGWVSPEMLGAQGDGRRDDSRPIANACLHLSQTGGGELRLEEARYLCSGAFDLPADVSIVGKGESSIFLIKRDNLLNVNGRVVRDVRLAMFQVRSTAPSRGRGVATMGVINRDIPGRVEGLELDGIIFDTPGYPGNNLFFKFGDASHCSRLHIRNCRFRGTGRMGLEIIQHDSPRTESVTGILVEANHFEGTGPVPELAVQCSVSGQMQGPSITGNRFLGQDTYVGLELVGELVKPRVTGNEWSGLFLNCVQNTSNPRKGRLRQLDFSQNRTLDGTRGTFKFAASYGGKFYQNDLAVRDYVVLHFQGASTENVVSQSTLATTHTTALFFDNCGRNSVTENKIKMMGEEIATPIIASGRLAIGNRVDDNRFHGKRMGTLFFSVGGASRSGSVGTRFD